MNYERFATIIDNLSSRSPTYPDLHRGCVFAPWHVRDDSMRRRSQHPILGWRSFLAAYPSTERDDRFLPASRSASRRFVGLRTTTRRDFWTKCVCRGGCCVWKETLRDPPRRARMELKRVSCAGFGGRSFAMSLLARTNAVLVDRDHGLHFNAEMKLPYDQESL